MEMKYFKSAAILFTKKRSIGPNEILFIVVAEGAANAEFKVEGLKKCLLDPGETFLRHKNQAQSMPATLISCIFVVP